MVIPRRPDRIIPTMRYKLISVDGTNIFELRDGARLLVGRAPSSDVPIIDPTISRRHAEIAVRAGLCLIRDLDSCNGTLLNGRLVGRARLRRGDVLVLGETVVRVR